MLIYSNKQSVAFDIKQTKGGIAVFQPDTKKAKQGDVIEFMREEKLLKGKVLRSQLKNSSVVDISVFQDLKELEVNHPNTVVAHDKYRVLPYHLRCN